MHLIYENPYWLTAVGEWISTLLIFLFIARELDYKLVWIILGQVHMHRKQVDVGYVIRNMDEDF